MKKPSKGFVKEMERMYPKGATITPAKSFKPCSGCPTPAKCKAAGKCLKGK